MKDKNHRPELVIEKAAVLDIKLAVKPGIIPFVEKALLFSTKVPIDLVRNAPLLPQIEEAFRKALAQLRVEMVEPPKQKTVVSWPARGA